MKKDHSLLFRQYPFKVGETIKIEDGSRKGDWEVIGLTKNKLKLKCLRSRKEYEWDRFCYLVTEKISANNF